MDKLVSEEIETRRSFLKKMGGAAASGIAVSSIGVPSIIGLTANDGIAQNGNSASNRRAIRAMQLRKRAAKDQMLEPLAEHPVNSDEYSYPNRIGNFSKSLPHNGLGEVNAAAYAALLTAVSSGKPADYAAIPMGGTVKLANPQAALSFQLEGADGEHLDIPAAPAVDSQTEAAEMAEVYWHALTRDVPFSNYATDPLVQATVNDLQQFPLFQNVTTATVFRGETAGDVVGPYVSQFLWKPVPYGAQTITQYYRVPVAGNDKMTSYPEWLNIQNGLPPSSPLSYDPTTRYIRNGRDLGEYVHLDFSYQAFLNAALILSGFGGGALSDTNPYKTIANQGGFVQFGGAHILDMVARAALAALKDAWYQKWQVHRRLRPEEYGGLVHKHLTGMASYPVTEILSSTAPAEVFNRFGTYLLPMAFAEGCPTHPAYPAGHAAISGACTTMLKAFFKESFVIPSPVEASDDGLSLNPYGSPLSVGNELNKLAANISLGRDMAGVHWRSDGIQGILLGEKVAIQILKDYRHTYNENFWGFLFTKFDGTNVTV
ncbi:MAG: vanadium-dependent haloperoxidase [Acidobacteriota bacterium]|nr:vanadium-dependent haloperoxidase [Acidobacteriota bacterium]